MPMAFRPGNPFVTCGFQADPFPHNEFFLELLKQPAALGRVQTMSRLYLKAGQFETPQAAGKLDLAPLLAITACIFQISAGKSSFPTPDHTTLCVANSLPYRHSFIFWIGSLKQLSSFIVVLQG